MYSFSPSSPQMFKLATRWIHPRSTSPYDLLHDHWLFCVSQVEVTKFHYNCYVLLKMNYFVTSILDITDQTFYDLLCECFPKLQEFLSSSPLPMVYPSLDNARSFRMSVFCTVFDIVLTSDFDQIFKTIELEDRSGLSTLRDRKLVPRSGEPPFEGRILGEPAESHYDDLLQRYVNAGTTNMMIVSAGTATFNNSLDRNDTDSVNTGPYPIVATPEEIIQTRK